MSEEKYVGMEEYLWRTICEAQEEVDAVDFPEMKLYINLFLVEGDVNPNYMWLADHLMTADIGKKMPDIIGDLIVSLYNYEIENNNNAMAMNNLGSLYYNGRRGRKDYEQAINYYEMADKAGCALATENLAYNYYYGLGTDIDYEKAYILFTKASLLGRYGARYKLGDMYRYGLYVDKDPKMVFKCYMQALDMCECEHEEIVKCTGSILYRIADAYYEGLGVTQSFLWAMKYYQKAELALYEQINAGDQYHIGKLEFVVKRQQKIHDILKENLLVYEY